MLVSDLFSSIYAHQGGWDEVLLVAGPLLLFLAVVVFATRRLSQAQPSHQPNHDESSLEQPVSSQTAASPTASQASPTTQASQHKEGIS